MNTIGDWNQENYIRTTRSQLLVAMAATSCPVKSANCYPVMALAEFDDVKANKQSDAVDSRTNYFFFRTG